ncbi:SDR family oxidoreductase [Maribacter sp. 2307ULW6-5]|uniref:SDR family oxidoreductase n=1 Tax=Maribacter sp. 2307ULW6-5 TaxID=3386275 RepID=UPI0039BD440E
MNQQFCIRDNLYALTGATGVLGASLASYLVRQGAQVILLGRSLEKLQANQNDLNGIAGNACHIFQVDVMDEAALHLVKEALAEQFGTLDGLVNMAGGNLPGATLKPGQQLHELSLEATRHAVDLNLFGSVNPTLVLSELMVARGKAAIVNVSSMAAKQGISRVLGYSMAKAGIDIFTKWLAQEMASRHGDAIRVNAIAPGFFMGNQNRRLLTNEDGSLTDRARKIIAHTPMGRFGETSELNGTIHYLLSDASRFVTGTILDVDGGFSSFSGV